MMPSRHYLIATAIRDTLLGDAELAHFDWRIRRRAIHKGRRWLPGAYVAIGTRRRVESENVLDHLIFQCPVVVVGVDRAGDLENGIEEHLGWVERVENIFREKAHGFAPAPLRAITAATVSWGDDQMAFEKVTVQEGATFAEGPWESNLDASGLLVDVLVRVPRRDVASLGE